MQRCHQCALQPGPSHMSAMHYTAVPHPAMHAPCAPARRSLRPHRPPRPQAATHPQHHSTTAPQHHRRPHPRTYLVGDVDDAGLHPVRHLKILLPGGHKLLALKHSGHHLQAARARVSGGAVCGAAHRLHRPFSGIYQWAPAGAHMDGCCCGALLPRALSPSLGATSWRWLRRTCCAEMSSSLMT